MHYPIIRRVTCPYRHRIQLLVATDPDLVHRIVYAARPRMRLPWIYFVLSGHRVESHEAAGRSTGLYDGLSLVCIETEVHLRRESHRVFQLFRIATGLVNVDIKLAWQ